MSYIKPGPATPTLYGIPLKLISLITLTVQNSSLILVMHYSRVMPGYDSSSRYYASTAVFLNELIKLCVCGIVAVRQHGLKETYTEVFASDSWKLAVPAILYTLQNTLQYTAVSNLDAATFQVTYQLKILTTAFFSVVMLQRVLSRPQWVSLLLLTAGIAMVQLPSDVVSAYFFKPPVDSSAGPGEADQKVNQKRQEATKGDEMNQFLGLVSVSIACILSGLAGVYFEKVLKGTQPSLWVRNVQLSFFSLFPAFFIGVLGKDGASISENGFFHGYNGVVWTAIFLQAFGGIIVALCVKYADNIAKNFATSISILLSCIASLVFFDDFILSSNFVLGSLMVVYATYLYSQPKKSES